MVCLRIALFSYRAEYPSPWYILIIDLLLWWELNSMWARELPLEKEKYQKKSGGKKLEKPYPLIDAADLQILSCSHVCFVHDNRTPHHLSSYYCRATNGFCTRAAYKRFHRVLSSVRNSRGTWQGRVWVEDHRRLLPKFPTSPCNLVQIRYFRLPFLFLQYRTRHISMTLTFDYYIWHQLTSSSLVLSIYARSCLPITVLPPPARPKQAARNDLPPQKEMLSHVWDVKSAKREWVLSSLAYGHHWLVTVISSAYQRHQAQVQSPHVQTVWAQRKTASTLTEPQMRSFSSSKPACRIREMY